MKCLSDYVQKEQDKLFEKCGVFFAFSKDQFKKGCSKVGANQDNKITDLDNGIYCLSKNVDLFIKEMENIQKKGIEQDIKENGIKKIIWRELGNYETQITEDISDVVSALEDYGISRDDIQKEFKDYFNYCVENDYF
jgi:hypothetical protein